ncbi:hypothetical protein CAPTEDRAFT_207886 [Capitella teleta]|uniref:Uncharacterized protein n=1 Tax=Capitella teleta TaxID=283909 RepID=R7VG31_CAPTE|nr:hypothetical protein CAPTEDRAFT_207886 [Capitella teleta]|eukprot:ELU17579.1 hypothetical protein CAPTEDRAFT_207886 [Capitella teleta]
MDNLAVICDPGTLGSADLGEPSPAGNGESVGLADKKQAKYYGREIATVTQGTPQQDAQFPRSVFIGRVEANQRVIVQSRKDQWRVFNILWNQGFALVMSYLLALVTFIMFIHLESLPRLPFPLIKNLLDFDPDFDPYNWWPEGSSLVLCVWGVIYLRKLFLLVLWTGVKGHVFNDYYHSSVPMGDNKRQKRSGERCLSLLVIGFHALFGIWTGWANNKYNDYIITEPLLLVLGMCLLVASEIIMLASSVYHVAKSMSQGQWFVFGKYGCEIVTWIGFALVSFTLPACLLLAIRLILTIYLVKCERRASCCC